MKFLRYMTAVILMAACVTESCAKQVKAEHFYMFGFAASFKDSTVYITDIQDVQGVWVDTKTKFLLDRDSYSQQLRQWLADKRQQTGRVCMVIFAKTKSNAEKKLAKLKKKYQGKNTLPYDICYVSMEDFKFTPIETEIEAVSD